MKGIRINTVRESNTQILTGNTSYKQLKGEAVSRQTINTETHYFSVASFPSRVTSQILQIFCRKGETARRAWKGKAGKENSVGSVGGTCG